MIKYLSKLYLPDKYFVTYRDEDGNWLDVPLMSYDFKDLINQIKNSASKYMHKYFKIVLYNPDADDKFPSEGFQSKTEDEYIEYTLNLRKHAKCRNIFVSTSLNVIYGESFLMDNGANYIKIDYSYIYGNYRNKFKIGDIVSTSILEYDRITRISNIMYGKLKLQVGTIGRALPEFDRNCSIELIVKDNSKVFEINPNLEFRSFDLDDFCMVIPACTLRKISGT